MTQSRNQASLVRQAIRLAWGQGEPEGDLKRMLERSDTTVMRYFRRNTAALAGPLQSVLEDVFQINKGNTRVPLRIQTLYMYLDEVLAGRMDQHEEHLEQALTRIKEQL